MAAYTNAQMALMCAAEQTDRWSGNERQSEEEMTRRTVARAHHYLAFLEESDALTEEDQDA